ncbi:MAG: endonuclease/exonuclease/phosphatase family protein [Pseudomonadota bacterium]
MHHGKVSAEVAAGLLMLKKSLDEAKIPSSKLDETINIATWNIREFGKVPRNDASIHYIAEILGQFDLIAIVELRNNLEDLGKVMTYLGDSWRVVYSDWSDDRGGNDERTAFLYDRRAVTHTGLAAEVDAQRVKEGTEWVTKESFWRAPYLCSFRSGNFDFLALALHARWGDSNDARRDELQRFSNWIKRRFASKYVEDHDLLVFGDFNTPTIKDEIFAALVDCGLQIPKPLVQLKAGKRTIGGSNLKGNARYDQILHLPTVPENFTNAGGVVDFFVDETNIAKLYPGKNYTVQQFTFQMSDHFPVWIQIKTDIEGFRLNQIIQAKSK